MSYINKSTLSADDNREVRKESVSKTVKKQIRNVEFADFEINKDKTGSFSEVKSVKVKPDSVGKLDLILKRLDEQSKFNKRLKSDVADLKSDVADLKSDVADLKVRVTKIEGVLVRNNLR